MISGFCVLLPALSQLRETVQLCLVSLPCTLFWKFGPDSKLGNLRVHPGAELLGPRVCVYSALAVRKLSQVIAPGPTE